MQKVFDEDFLVNMVKIFSTQSSFNLNNFVGLSFEACAINADEFLISVPLDLTMIWAGVLIRNKHSVP